MKPHLKKEILQFKELNGSLYTGCNSGMVILDRNLEYLQPLLKRTTNLAFKLSKLDLKKLKTFKDMEQYTQDHDIIKIGNCYFSAFRLYALLSKVEYRKGSIEIFNTGDSTEYPILIKANGKEMYLAPHILSDYGEKEWVKNIPSIESFGEKL